ncbi:MAG: ABC transporter ATP-binding protein [Clostridiales bacterium]|jgi:cobalt/nickel transport system ATP-binding protein|nr:ABC transporter ATP-binding protein [Clostridiales bacterium]
MSHHHIICSNVSFSYEKNHEILHDISFSAGHDDAIGLIGANGVGKSTLLRILVGLEMGFTGEVSIGEIRLTKKTLPRIREKIGYVFQDSENQLFMPTVYEDIAFAPRNYGLDADQVEERVSHALNLIGINYLRDKQTYKMSGGEKKMAAIATILAMTPDVILMDEPTIALDPKNRRRLINILNSLDHIKIIASHDLDMVLETCNRVILMSEGKIIADGAARNILTDKDLLEANGLELPLCLQGESDISWHPGEPHGHIHL